MPLLNTNLTYTMWVMSHIPLLSRKWDRPKKQLYLHYVGQVQRLFYFFQIRHRSTVFSRGSFKRFLQGVAHFLGGRLLDPGGVLFHLMVIGVTTGRLASPEAVLT